MELISLIRISAHGSSCSTAVDQRSKTLEVVGSNSTRCRAFFLHFSIPSVVRPSFRSFMEVQHF